MKYRVAMAAAAALALLAHPSSAPCRDTPAAGEARAIATEAYIYLYPLVLMDVTRESLTNAPAGSKPGAGPPNVFSHIRAYPAADMRDVVRPNFDTLYSIAWLDVTAEPVVVSVPDTEGRYYLLPMIDMWSDVFAVPGKRTTGTAAGHYAVVPPSWSGTLPEGIESIVAPTPHAWVVGRTQTNGPSDYEAVHKVQDGYRITPLSQWGKDPVPVPFQPDPGADITTEPMSRVHGMTAEQFFDRGARLMATNPPHLSDWSQVARLKRIGIEPGKPFELDTAAADVRSAIEGAPEEAMGLMRSKLPTIARVSNGWQMNTDTMGVYGNYYLKRAIVAQVGLGANQPEDAIYPMLLADSNGEPLDGQRDYVLHFEKRQLPPVDAFWSVTMYDANGYQVANPLGRFAIGDRDSLKFNADGSLDIYMQHETPSPEKESNWLPSPKEGVLGVTMRLYAPRAEALDGRWNPPAVKLAPEE